MSQDTQDTPVPDPAPDPAADPAADAPSAPAEPPTDTTPVTDVSSETADALPESAASPEPAASPDTAVPDAPAPAAATGDASAAAPASAVGAAPAAAAGAASVAEAAAGLPAAMPAPIPGAFPDEDAIPAEPQKQFVPRRRGRTTLLIALAAVLGVVAGGGLGYHIQQGRKPTPLPPLTGPILAQPKGAGPSAPSLPASQDRQAVYGGDLLKLLIPFPKGAKHAERDWLPLRDYAEDFEGSSQAFTDLAGKDFQRAVRADWGDSQGVFHEVLLTQLRDEGSTAAMDLFKQWMWDYDGDYRFGDAVSLPNVLSGYVWPSKAPDRKPGYLPVYEGRGMAEVGNIIIEVFVDSTHPVKSAAITSVINQQLERL